MTDDFLLHLRDVPGSCSPSVKESHWRTWQRAQEAFAARLNENKTVEVESEDR